jgi:predicted DNA-binding transcriptional regulator YafY
MPHFAARQEAPAAPPGQNLLGVAGRTDKAAREFLAFGDAVEVLGPPELRTRIANLANATAALYC